MHIYAFISKMCTIKQNITSLASFIIEGSFFFSLHGIGRCYFFLYIKCEIIKSEYLFLITHLQEAKIVFTVTTKNFKLC